jgi:hypothetical protein
MAHHFLQRVQNGVQTAAGIAGGQHTAYQIGKSLYGLAQAAAPYALALL